MAGFGSKTDEATDSLVCYCQESLVADQSNLFWVLLGIAGIVFSALRGEDESLSPQTDVTVSGCWNVVSAQFSHLPRTFSTQHICCCPAAETYRQNPWNTVPAYFLFESLFSHPEKTVAGRRGNYLRRPFISYTVCLIFFNQLFSGGHIFQNVTKNSLGLLRFKDSPRPLNVLPADTTGFPSVALLVASSLYSLKAKNRTLFPLNSFYWMRQIWHSYTNYKRLKNSLNSVTVLDLTIIFKPFRNTSLEQILQQTLNMELESFLSQTYRKLPGWSLEVKD